MEGPVVVLLVGLLALGAAAWRDRVTRLRAEQALGAPPDRPGLPELATPAYVTPPDADRVRDLPGLDEEALAAFQTVRDGGERVDLALADERFATSVGRLHLADALVLACADEPGTIRELLPHCSAAIAAGRPLVVACPGIDPATLTTLVANLYRGTLDCAVLTGAADQCARLAELAGGRVVDRADRQSGLGPEHCLGRVPELAADATGTGVLVAGETAPGLNLK